MPSTKLGLAVGSLLVCIFACGCREPVEPSFFNGTWSALYGGGMGNVHIDLARRQFLTSLGLPDSYGPPFEFDIELITPIEGGIRLTLRRVLPGAEEGDFASFDWEFRRIAEDKMRFTDDVGDSAVWRRVERENAQRSEKAK